MTFNEDGIGRRHGGGRRMLRAAAWTVGLFGAGAALCRLFPAGWFEPVVLVALGVTLLGVSRGGARRPRARVAAPKQAAA